MEINQLTIPLRFTELWQEGVKPNRCGKKKKLQLSKHPSGTEAAAVPGWPLGAHGWINKLWLPMFKFLGEEAV